MHAGLEIKVSGPVGLRVLGKIASKQYCPMQAKSWESSVLDPRPQDRRIFYRQNSSAWARI